MLACLLALAVAIRTRRRAAGREERENESDRHARKARESAGGSAVSFRRHGKSFNLPRHGSGMGMRLVISGGRPGKLKSTDSRLILWTLKRTSTTSPSRALMIPVSYTHLRAHETDSY